MKYYYSVRTDIVSTEDGESAIVYGVDVTDENGLLLQSIPDIFFDKSKAEDFARDCNDGGLDIVHIMDVVEDVLEEMYSC